MKNLKLDDLKIREIDYSKIVNHTQDVSVDSILCIDHHDREKLDHYIELSLKQNPKYIITSSRSEVLKDSGIKQEMPEAPQVDDTISNYLDKNCTKSISEVLKNFDQTKEEREK